MNMTDDREERFYKAVTCLLLGIEYLPNLKNIYYLRTSSGQHRNNFMRNNFFNARERQYYQKNYYNFNPRRGNYEFPYINRIRRKNNEHYD
ncbi:hypothetical protein AAJ76_5000127954 [Vairimorpha ceranae]|nr:hypothetical protein AAJ76_5000127954 [Vairimorpha ceranae]KAF5140985.1 hypothetical protein G9O61_00g008290 [Vairimorpha ceranae]KKO76290.1 hypothetical protein AAJ76_5000127954 [Vairimorpha ceranae]